MKYTIITTLQAICIIALIIGITFAIRMLLLQEVRVNDIAVTFCSAFLALVTWLGCEIMEHR